MTALSRAHSCRHCQRLTLDLRSVSNDRALPQFNFDFTTQDVRSAAEAGCALCLRLEHLFNQAKPMPLGNNLNLFADYSHPGESYIERLHSFGVVLSYETHAKTKNFSSTTRLTH